LLVTAVTLGGDRWATCLETYPTVVPFAATPADSLERGLLDQSEIRRKAIALTFHRLAVTAVDEMWDGRLVIQDDVRFRGDIPDGYGIFGRWRGRGHWCPQAFRFDQATWRRVLECWDGEQQICQAWEPVVDDQPRFDLASDHLDIGPLPPSRWNPVTPVRLPG
jgi:hypothetical protein